ncbi:hypothetical protein ACFFRR_008996 [Megaselia abdita]
MDENVDIYGDLDVDEIYQEKNKERENARIAELESEIKKNSLDIEKLKKDNERLNKKVKIMETNFNNLLDVVKKEISRKDNQIDSLRKEKDNLIFRRKTGQENVQENRSNGNRKEDPKKPSDRRDEKDRRRDSREEVHRERREEGPRDRKTDSRDDVHRDDKINRGRNSRDERDDRRIDDKRTDSRDRRRSRSRDRKRKRSKSPVNRKTRAARDNEDESCNHRPKEAVVKEDDSEFQAQRQCILAQLKEESDSTPSTPSSCLFSSPDKKPPLPMISTISPDVVSMKLESLFGNTPSHNENEVFTAVPLENVRIEAKLEIGDDSMDLEYNNNIEVELNKNEVSALNPSRKQVTVVTFKETLGGTNQEVRETDKKEVPDPPEKESVTNSSRKQVTVLTAKETLGDSLVNFIEKDKNCITESKDLEKASSAEISQEVSEKVSDTVIVNQNEKQKKFEPKEPQKSEGSSKVKKGPALRKKSELKVIKKSSEPLPRERKAPSPKKKLEPKNKRDAKDSSKKNDEFKNILKEKEDLKNNRAKETKNKDDFKSTNDKFDSKDSKNNKNSNDKNKEHLKDTKKTKNEKSPEDLKIKENEFHHLNKNNDLNAPINNVYKIPMDDPGKDNSQKVSIKDDLQKDSSKDPLLSSQDKPSLKNKGKKTNSKDIRKPSENTENDEELKPSKELDLKNDPPQKNHPIVQDSEEVEIEISLNNSSEEENVEIKKVDQPVVQNVLESHSQKEDKPSEERKENIPKDNQKPQNVEIIPSNLESTTKKRKQSIEMKEPPPKQLKTDDNTEIPGQLICDEELFSSSESFYKQKIELNESFNKPKTESSFNIPDNSYISETLLKDLELSNITTDNSSFLDTSVSMTNLSSGPSNTKNISTSSRDYIIEAVDEYVTNVTIVRKKRKGKKNLKK